MRKFIKKFKNSIFGKLLRFILSLIKWLLEFTIIIVALVIVVQRVTNNERSFMGYRIFNVVTKSMEPEYIVGDILIARQVDPEDIKIGDNLVYQGMEKDYKNKIITHKVIDIQRDEEGKLIFHTKGVANELEDPIVHQNQIYGIVVNNNKIISFICKVIGNKYGLYFFVILPIVIYAFIAFFKLQGRKVEDEKIEPKDKKEE